jgi:hypothetical protein
VTPVNCPLFSLPCLSVYSSFEVAGQANRNMWPKTTFSAEIVADLKVFEDGSVSLLARDGAKGEGSCSFKLPCPAISTSNICRRRTYLSQRP